MSNGELLNAAAGTYQANQNILVTQPYTVQTTGALWAPQQPIIRAPEAKPDLGPLEWLRAQVDEITELATL